MENEEVSKGKLFAQGLAIHWRFIFMLIWPFVCGLVFTGGSDVAFRCMYVVLLMAGYWVCEVLPLGITGLIPIALFPILGILDTANTCKTYLNNTTMMFLTSIFIAFAIESSNLHRRIALGTILLIGTTHLRLSFGFMFVTMFVSMWIINTAATAMMAPVVLAVLKELEESDFVTVFLPPTNEEEEEKPIPTRTTRCYFLGIAYASSIGGVGTLIGTGTNLTFKGIFEERFPEAPIVDFGEWIGAMWLPMVITNFLTWGALSFLYLGLFRRHGGGMDEVTLRSKLETRDQAKEAAEVARKVIKQKFDELGRFTWAEWWVTVLFLIVVALWITVDPSWMTGWGPLISSKKIQSATPGVIVCLLVFAIPVFPTIIYCLSKDPEKRPRRQEDTILVWKTSEKQMMWGLLFLLGAGFALAKGSNDSGMSAMIGDMLQGLQYLPAWVVLFLVCLVACIITNFTSNVAIANIILPVISEMAIAIEINPTYLMLPATVCCSFAFMLPVGTPPNALIAGYANVRTKDMVIAGIFPTVFALLSLVGLFPTYGSLLYTNLNEFPDWAQKNDSKP